MNSSSRPNEQQRGINTLSGVIRLVRIIEYCQIRLGSEDRPESDRAFGIRAGVSHTSISDWKRVPDERIVPPRIDYLSLRAIGPHLWIPFSETDPATGQMMPRLAFDGLELRAICEGRAWCRVDPIEPMRPFAARIERDRALRGHTYEQLVEESLLPPDAVLRIRRLLAFGGWAESGPETLGDYIALSRYVGMSLDEIAQLAKESNPDNLST